MLREKRTACRRSQEMARIWVVDRLEGPFPSNYYDGLTPSPPQGETSCNPTEERSRYCISSRVHDLPHSEFGSGFLVRTKKFHETRRWRAGSGFLPGCHLVPLLRSSGHQLRHKLPSNGSFFFFLLQSCRRYDQGCMLSRREERT